MKNVVIGLLVGIAFSLNAQTKVERKLEVKKGQTIAMNFDYPNLIKVTTWDKNEIQIEGQISINGGESDEAFELTTSSDGNRISISSIIKNFDKLPRRITVKQQGQKLSFKNKAEYKAYFKDKAKDFEMWSENVEIEIELSIKVPSQVETVIESIYGMVEVSNFNGPLIVNATYGGTDVAIQEKSIGQLTASTNYGEIYSNLDKKFDNNALKEEDFHTVVSTKLGSGPIYKLASQYGNVYLRKASAN